MIDIIFQLLIFFMISSTFLCPSLGIQLPKISGSHETPQAQPLTLTLQGDGICYVNNEKIASSEITSTLQRAMEVSQSQSLYFKADKNIPYDHVLTSLQAAGQAGINQFYFVYQDEVKSNSEA